MLALARSLALHTAGKPFAAMLTTEGEHAALGLPNPKLAVGALELDFRYSALDGRIGETQRCVGAHRGHDAGNRALRGRRVTANGLLEQRIVDAVQLQWPAVLGRNKRADESVTLTTVGVRPTGDTVARITGVVEPEPAGRDAGRSR